VDADTLNTSTALESEEKRTDKKSGSETEQRGERVSDRPVALPGGAGSGAGGNSGRPQWKRQHTDRRQTTHGEHKAEQRRKTADRDRQRNGCQSWRPHRPATAALRGAIPTDGVAVDSLISGALDA
jgi:hypothetical protein